MQLISWVMWCAGVSNGWRIRYANKNGVLTKIWLRPSRCISTVFNSHRQINLWQIKAYSLWIALTDWRNFSSATIFLSSLESPCTALSKLRHLSKSSCAFSIRRESCSRREPIISFAILLSVQVSVLMSTLTSPPFDTILHNKTQILRITSPYDN